VVVGGLVQDLVDVVAAERAALAGGQPAFAVDLLRQLQGLPAVRRQAGREGVLLERAPRGEEGAHRVRVVVPAGAGARGPADEPRLAAGGAFEADPGTALGVEREGRDQLGVGRGAPHEVQEVGLGGDA